MTRLIEKSPSSRRCTRSWRHARIFSTIILPSREECSVWKSACVLCTPSIWRRKSLASDPHLTTTPLSALAERRHASVRALINCAVHFAVGRYKARQQVLRRAADAVKSRCRPSLPPGCAKAFAAPRMEPPSSPFWPESQLLCYPSRSPQQLTLCARLSCTKRTFWPAEVNSLLELQPASSKAAPTSLLNILPACYSPAIDELDALARM